MQDKLKIFIEKAKGKHGDKYDYSLVKYKNAKTKVKIICSEHGEFEQVPDNHIRRSGCPKCGGSKKQTLEEFISKAKQIHTDKYDYSKVEYINNSTKVTIICPEHGEFEQTPKQHLISGCWKCGVIERSESRKLNTDDFISRAKEVHGDYFNYDKTIYTGHRNKVIIICPKHSEFEQKANGHLNGQGCPVCRESKGERKIRLWLEASSFEFIPQYRFNDCKYKRPLPFDFYLPDYNMCIEYDGEQHFKETMFSSNNELDEIMKKDSLKNKYCRNNNIKLLRIKYTEYKEIERILNEQF